MTRILRRLFMMLVSKYCTLTATDKALIQECMEIITCDAVEPVKKQVEELQQDIMHLRFMLQCIERGEKYPVDLQWEGLDSNKYWTELAAKVQQAGGQVLGEAIAVGMGSATGNIGEVREAEGKGEGSKKRTEPKLKEGEPEKAIALLREGYSVSEVARRLGYQGRSIHAAISRLREEMRAGIVSLTISHEEKYPPMPQDMVM